MSLWGDLLSSLTLPSLLQCMVNAFQCCARLRPCSYPSTRIFRFSRVQRWFADRLWDHTMVFRICQQSIGHTHEVEHDAMDPIWIPVSWKQWTNTFITDACFCLIRMLNVLTPQLGSLDDKQRQHKHRSTSNQHDCKKNIIHSVCRFT